MIDDHIEEAEYCTPSGSCKKQDYPVELHEVISQYQDSPNLKAYIDTFVDEGKNIITDLESLTMALATDCVTGKALDQIGEIVGQDRIWYDPFSIPWFGFEGAANPLQLGFDQGKLWDGITDVTANFIEADDTTHRMFIKAKMAKNNFKGTVNAMLDSLFMITCRTDIRLNTGNGLFLKPFVMEDMLRDGTTGGWSDGVFSDGSGVTYEPMKFYIETSVAYPIDPATKQFILNYDLLPRPSGVQLVDIIP